MAASTSDKLRRASSGTRPEPTYLTSPLNTGASSATVNSTTGWNTVTGQDFVIYRIDTSGNKIAGTQTDWICVVSGTSLNNLVLKAGSIPSGGYPAGTQSVVVATPTAAWGDSVVDWGTTQHNQDGTHNAAAASSIATQFATGSIATSKLADDAGIGTAKLADDSVTAAKMQYGMVRNRQGGTTGDASWQTTGTSNTDTSAKAVFIQVGAAVTSSGAVTVTFPTAYAQIPAVFCQVSSATSNNVFIRATSITTTGFIGTVIVGSTGSLGAAENFSWLAIGQ